MSIYRRANIVLIHHSIVPSPASDITPSRKPRRFSKKMDSLTPTRTADEIRESERQMRPRSRPTRPARLRSLPRRFFPPLQCRTNEANRLQCVRAHLVVPCFHFSISAFETRSLPALTRSYPRRFTFYVARPARSIQFFNVFDSRMEMFNAANLTGEPFSCQAPYA